MRKNIPIKPNQTKINGHKTVLSKNEIADDSPVGLRAFLDATQEAYILYDKNLKAVACNKSFSHAVKEITGKLPSANFDLLDLVSPERKILFRRKMFAALRGKTAEYEVLYDRPYKRWLHIYIHPVKNQNDKITGICVSVKDITKHKKDQEDLKYRAALLDNIDTAVISTDLNFRITEINKAGENIYGLNASEVLGKIHKRVFAFQFIGTAEKQVYNCIQTTGKWNGEAVFTRRDGKKIILSSSVTTVYDEKGEKIGFVGVDRDITEQRVTEEKAQRSETYMKSILDSTPEALFLINPGYDIVTFNPRAYIIMSKFLKVCIEEGMNLIDILPDFRKDDAKQKLDYVSLGNFIEYEVQYPDGSWLLVSFSPVKNKEGKVSEICVGLRDISRRKNVEHKLRKNDQQYRSLVDSLSEGVIFQSFDKRIITFNDSATEILGIPGESLQRYGFPLPGCLAIDEKREKLDIKEIIRNRVFEGQSVRGLTAGIDGNTGMKWLSINIEPVRNEEGLAYAYVITLRDITDKFKNREELNLLSKVVKETSNIVVITDNEEKIVWANDAFSRISEYPLEEAKNKKPGSLLNGPEKDKKEVNKIKEALKKGIPVEGDILNYTKTGKKYWAHYNIHPVHDENGKLVKFFSIQSDITESKKLQEEINRQKELRHKAKTRATIKGQEKERNEVGQELHDNIQQILGAAKLQLDCALSMAPDNTDYIRNGIDNIKLSIEEIRRFSKRLVAPRFQESSLINEIDSQLANLGIYDIVCMDTSEFDEELLSDAAKLAVFRIIQEQLTNIVKHAKASAVNICLKNEKSNIILEIGDDGVGFDPAKKRNGIGLSNILSRAELFGGSAKIISAPAKGCKLHVTIPLKNEDDFTD